MVPFVPMKRPILTASQAALIRKLALRYRTAAKLPKPWNDRTADELWWKIVGEIAAQGNARAGFVIENSYEAKRQTSLSRLKAFRTDQERLRHIHWVFATVRSRYIRKNFRRDPKSRAVLRNFHTLTGKGGPKGFFRRIANERSEPTRIEALQELAGYGPKTARDTAIELGLAKNCLALDTRLRALLSAVGAQTDRASYDAIEKAMLTKVVRPRLTGGQLDRILFQNYDKILADIKLARSHH
jgi:hypothetical protein